MTVVEVQSPTMTYADARDLTADLREHLAISGALLLEAYERRAYLALGYSTWRDYVQRELAVAWSSVQRRLDHARLVKAMIQMGAAQDALPAVPLHYAGEALRHVGEISEADDPVVALEDVIAGMRAKRDVAATSDEMQANLLRMQPLIERAATAVGMAPMDWLRRAVTAAATMSGACD